MKVLLDTCLSVQAREALEAAGHDVVWGGDWEVDPGDDAILALAFREARVVITLDKDFGELAVFRGTRHAGIIRLVDFSVRQQAAVRLKVLADHAAELEQGCPITVQPGRIRIRRTRE